MVIVQPSNSTPCQPQHLPKSVSSQQGQPSQYQILELVGQGQYGKVYCGFHRQTGQLFALKELDPQKFPSKKFLREFRFLASLRHQNVVSCHTVEYNPTGRYLVMDYCEGGTLRQYLESGQLDLKTGLKLVLDILRGLHYIHQRGLVHCDLKPENVLMHLEASGWVAKLSDFGVARSPEEVITGSMGDTGSPAYMAPERFYGQYSFSSDLYAVGIILYEVVIGKRPFGGMPAELMSAHINQSVEVSKDVPYLLRCAIKRALHKLPAKRYDDAKEMYKAVQVASQVLTMESQTFASPVQWTPLTAVSLEKTEPIGAIALDPEQNQLYLATGKKVVCKRYQDTLLDSDIVKRWDVKLAHKILGFYLRPPTGKDSVDGCFVETEGFGIYRFPQKAMSLWRDSQKPLFSFPVGAMRSVIAPGGSWIVLALGDAWSNIAHYDSANFQILQLPDLHSVKPPLSCPFPSGLLALDDYHGLIAFPQIDPKTKAESTLMRLFTRRGDFLTRFTLPFNLKHLTLGKTPYQVFAVTTNTQHGVLINLKPFSLTRIKLPFNPQWVLASESGYLLANAEGQILQVDSEGTEMGRFQLEVREKISAIACAQPKVIAPDNKQDLLVATTAGEKGWLSKFNLPS
jgi:serine/threonine protein kinase